MIHERTPDSGARTKSRVLLTHPGTQYSYQLARQLERLQLLDHFVTCIAFGSDSLLLRFLPPGLRKKMQRRVVAGVPFRRLWRLPLPELIAFRELRRGRPAVDVHAKRNLAFQRAIPQRLIEAADCVIGFDSSSLLLIERCRKAGKKFILDGSIAHPLSQQAVFEELRSRFPAWQKQLPVKPALLVERELQEMASADHIVVASQFSAGSYEANGIARHRLSINHYGVNLAYFRSKWEENSRIASQLRPLRFLCFGQVSARKGFPWLTAVWDKFHQQYPHTELVAAGYGEPPRGFELPGGIRVTGFIHPDDRLRLFHDADVFVFPSYFEGFAQVIVEAMACGLPVITTTATVGPEIIENATEGFVTEPGDDEALYRHFSWFAEHPGVIESMGKKAAGRVKAMTWDAYGERWQRIIENVVAGESMGQ